MHSGSGIHVATIPGTFIPVANRGNDYLLDRQAQKERRSFCGVIGVGDQDAAIQESMGPIQERAREHPVSTDNGITMTRRKLLAAAQACAGGGSVPGLDAASQSMRAFSAVLPRNVPLEQAPQLHP
jgi:hypothetical protein